MYTRNPCNSDHNTSPNMYRRRLMNNYSEEFVAELDRIKQVNPELTYIELLAIRDGLREELKQWHGF